MLANGSDRVDANQQGRDALLRIEQLLNSSCVAGVGVSPVVAAVRRLRGGAERPELDHVLRISERRSDGRAKRIRR